jgi:hypothetical protein
MILLEEGMQKLRNFVHTAVHNLIQKLKSAKRLGFLEMFSNSK